MWVCVRVLVLCPNVSVQLLLVLESCVAEEEEEKLCANVGREREGRGRGEEGSYLC